MEMGSHLAPYEEEEEDYISMELTSSSPQIKEFEFQNSSASAAKESAADDLFYKGKLLPLHLPPRRQMVEHLLRTSSSTAPCTTSNTPSDSRNISPSESCRVSCDLNPSDAALFQWPTEITAFFNNHPTNNTNSWPKKLKIKLINHSFLAQKLKSSTAYLKSLFTKSETQASKADAVKYSRIGKKLATLVRKNGIDDHRRSFSGAITVDSTTNCSSNSSFSSSSSSFNSSSGVHEAQFLRRTSSAAEIEVSIDAAIAHCKKSMQSFGIY